MNSCWCYELDDKKGSKIYMIKFKKDTNADLFLKFQGKRHDHRTGKLLKSIYETLYHRKVKYANDFDLPLFYDFFKKEGVFCLSGKSLNQLDDFTIYKRRKKVSDKNACEKWGTNVINNCNFESIDGNVVKDWHKDYYYDRCGVETSTDDVFPEYKGRMFYSGDRVRNRIEGEGKGTVLRSIKIEMESSINANESNENIDSTKKLISSLVETHSNKVADLEDTINKLESDLEISSELVETAVSEIKKHKSYIVDLEERIQDSEELIISFNDVLKERMDVHESSSEKLVNAILNERKRSNVDNFIEKELDGNPNADLIRPLLHECKTVKNAKKHIRNIQAISKKKNSHGDLPIISESIDHGNYVEGLEEVDENVKMGQELIRRMGGR